MFCFLRSTKLESDSRLNRYIRCCLNSSKKVYVLDWHKHSGQSIYPSNEIAFDRFALQNRSDSKFSKYLDLIRFNFWIFIKLLSRAKKIQVIHAIDLDTVMPALVIGKIFSIPVIFDIYDSYGEAREMTGLVRYLVDSLERFATNVVSRVIYPDICRIPLELRKERNRIYVIENVPIGKPLETSAYQTNRLEEFHGITLGYLGILESKHRGLENIAELVISEPDRYRLVVVGFGPLEDYFRKAAASHQNIVMFGQSKHDDGLRIISQCDVMLGMYYLSKPHHQFAAPNKYFEHLMLGIPLLTTKHTPPGNKVEILGTGWVCDDSKKDLIATLDKISKIECQERGGKAKIIWGKNYADYFKNYLCTTYNQILQTFS